MPDYSNLTQRNKGIISDKEQEKLHKSVIAVAGCGAGGGAAALSLARLGARNFRLADPDIIDESNINRQEGAFTSTLGKNKAKVISKLIKDVDPKANVRVFQDGVSVKNVDQFLSGADIVLEEIDYRKPQYTLLVHQAARRLNIPLVTGIPVAWNAFFFYFPSDGMTYEKYVGIEGHSENINSTNVNPMAYAPEIPLYLSKEMLKDVFQEKIDIPAVEPAVKLAAAMISTFTFYLLTNSREVKPVPYYYSAGDIFLKQESRINPKEAESWNKKLLDL